MAATAARDDAHCHKVEVLDKLFDSFLSIPGCVLAENGEFTVVALRVKRPWREVAQELLATHQAGAEREGTPLG
jgi:hypothetical protein